MKLLVRSTGNNNVIAVALLIPVAIFVNYCVEAQNAFVVVVAALLALASCYPVFVYATAGFLIRENDVVVRGFGKSEHIPREDIIEVPILQGKTFCFIALKTSDGQLYTTLGATGNFRTSAGTVALQQKLSEALKLPRLLL